jgi:uncharacterized membrane protein YkvA (DUF1232 family)
MDEMDQFEDTDEDVDFEESMSDSSSVQLSGDRAQRFYDRARGSIQRYLEGKGSVASKSGEFLLLVPDMFMLLWRLVNDPRVNGRTKVLLGSGVAYYIFPFDLMPEALLGPVGYMDDLVFAVFLLNKMLGETDIEIVREHWSGSEDVLKVIQKVLGSAESLVGSKLVTRFKKML